MDVSPAGRLILCRYNIPALLEEGRMYMTLKDYKRMPF